MIGQGVTNRFQDMKTRSKLLLSFGLVSFIIMIMASVGVFTCASSVPSRKPCTWITRCRWRNSRRWEQRSPSITRFCWTSPLPRNKVTSRRKSKASSLEGRNRKSHQQLQRAPICECLDQAATKWDLTLFEPALKKYFQEADGASSAMADSFRSQYAVSGTG